MPDSDALAAQHKDAVHRQLIAWAHRASGLARFRRGDEPRATIAASPTTRAFPRLLVPAIVVTVLALNGCASRRPPAAPSKGPASAATAQGLASYYGAAFHGKLTASGVPFDMHAMVAAHPTYPFGTVLRVTNVENGRSVQVRVVDRGPAAGPRAAGVIIDLSQGAAEALDFIRAGRARVRLDVVQAGE
jgi:rare lipoprotein A